MITQIEGRLVAVEDGAAHVRTGDVTYEVLIPAADSMLLAASVGQTVVFHTLHYLEGQGQGSSFWPRLIGFRTPKDREFFELFTTVKGIGNRKALRALQLPFPVVADAIGARDLDTLQSLPEIGKRTAETICVELKGKVDRFARGPGGDVAVKFARRGGTAGNGAVDTSSRASQISDMANSAVAVLVQLGHTKLAAREMVERVLALEEVPATAGEIITAALR